MTAFSREIILDVSGPMTRVALKAGNDVEELYMELRGGEKLVGNIYMGKVQNILPGMQAAFIDIGLDKNAFLYAGDILSDPGDFFGADEKGVERQLLKNTAIKQLISVGQELLVQVIKEPGGTKGPRVTTNITIPGRTCVLAPTLDYVGVSRRIEDERERGRLKDEIESVKPCGMGVIVRTAAKGLDRQDFKSEIDALVGIYESLVARAKSTKAPKLMHSDEMLVYRIVRDMLTDDIDGLIINNRETLEDAICAAALYSPGLSSRIRLYSDDMPIFDAFNIECAVNTAMLRKVWLKNGGYLVFDQTEALTVIDVNTGKFVGTTSNLQDTVFAMNIEAAAEIARQIRLRDISGIIIVDFIDMLQENNRKALLNELKNAFRNDRTKTNVIGLTGLGLVEITRKKLRNSLSGITMRQCPVCQGRGRVLKAEQVVFSAVRDVQRLRAGGYVRDILIRINQPCFKQLAAIKDMPGTYCAVEDGFDAESYEIDMSPPEGFKKTAAPLFKL